MCKRYPNIYFIGLKKKTCLGCFEYRRSIRDKWQCNRVWKEGKEEIEMSIYSCFSIYAIALALLRFCILLTSSSLLSRWICRRCSSSTSVSCCAFRAAATVPSWRGNDMGAPGWKDSRWFISCITCIPRQTSNIGPIYKK